MILVPYSYNGTSLQSTDYDTIIPRASALLQTTSNPSYVMRAGAYPLMSGKEFQPTTITLAVECLHDHMTLFESLNTLFDCRDETPRQLICTDSEDSDKQYYVYASPMRVTGGNDGAMATVTLALDDPIWQSVTQNSTTKNMTSATDSTSVTAAGNDESYPIFEITPTSLPSTDYRYGRYIRVLPQATRPWPNRPLDLCGSTSGTLDTSALIAAGKMTTDGDDLRVFQDGVEVDRWLGSYGTTDTRIYITADMPSASELTLGTAIGATDTVTEIEFNYTNSNKAALSRMPEEGLVVIDTTLGSTDSEEFSYTARTITSTKLALTVDSRAARNTTALIHAVNSNVRYIPYDFMLLYGNAAATAPDVDDTNKPIITLTSSNSSLTYTSGFRDLEGHRAGSWIPSQLPGSETISPVGYRSGIYTSTNDVSDTDPAKVMGIKAMSQRWAGAWRPDTVNISWTAYFPDLVASVGSVTGEKYQTVAGIPTISLQSSTDGSVWQTLWNVAAQSATDYSTWTTWSKASTDATIPANTKYLRFIQYGTISGSTDNASKAAIDAVTVGVTNYPHITIGSELDTSTVKLRIYNDTTGEWLQVYYPVPPNKTVTIDTDPDFPSARCAGRLINGAVKLSSKRAKWLKLQAGANNIGFTNLLLATENITIVTKWRDRMNFL